MLALGLDRTARPGTLAGGCAGNKRLAGQATAITANDPPGHAAR
jgi:hypothetical protein